MYYVVTTDKSFDQASADLELAVKNHGYGVLHVHDLGGTLRSKGVAFDNAGESLFLPKDFFELPSRKKSAKTTRPLMPAAPRFVRVTLFRPNKGSEHRLSHDLTPCRDALQVFSASLR